MNDEPKPPADATETASKVRIRASLRVDLLDKLRDAAEEEFGLKHQNRILERALIRELDRMDESIKGWGTVSITVEPLPETRERRFTTTTIDRKLHERFRAMAERIYGGGKRGNLLIEQALEHEFALMKWEKDQAKQPGYYGNSCVVSGMPAYED